MLMSSEDVAIHLRGRMRLTACAPLASARGGSGTKSEQLSGATPPVVLRFLLHPRFQPSVLPIQEKCDDL